MSSNAHIEPRTPWHHHGTHVRPVQRELFLERGLAFRFDHPQCALHATTDATIAQPTPLRAAGRGLLIAALLATRWAAFHRDIKVPP